ncbi:D-alanyl-D-alanine carboxypeptidase family protein [Streptococcus australis]|uniref:D-alanyl-D-alanine carboxypeptidase family protein n=1 Tax=Streptococcus australis TaxID=113107 RepID=UPI0039C217E3
MKFKRALFATLSLACLCSPLLAKADDLYQQEDIMSITEKSGTSVDEFFRPKADIVVDAHTGAIVYGDNIDAPRDSGSMAKLMSVYVLLKAIQEGQLDYDTLITATDTDVIISQNQKLSNSPIVAGAKYKVSTLLNMIFVPSSSAATIMIANKVSGGDPDKFLDLMNQRAQEIGMTNTKWNNPNGAPTAVLDGYYNPTRYDQNAINQTTARDMAILAYHMVNEFPEILNYTKNAKITLFKGTDYEETHENYNYSLEGGRYSLKGADGLKTGSSPTADYNYTLTVNRGNQRFVQVIMGVGHYDVEIAESLRHVIGNALIERLYQDYEYKEVLPAGDHTIQGQTYHLEKPFYATVKRGTNPEVSVQNGQLQIANGLQTVSPSIQQTQAVSAVQASHQKSTSTRQKGWDPMWLFCFLPFIFLRVFFNIRYKRK